jgi:hypothetical protein
MKFLMFFLGSLLCFPSVSHAALIIEPNKNDRVYHLKKQNKDSALSSKYKHKRYETKESYCRYQRNDYRTERDSEMGCATNKNNINFKLHNLSNDS